MGRGVVLRSLEAFAERLPEDEKSGFANEMDVERRGNPAVLRRAEEFSACCGVNVADLR